MDTVRRARHRAKRAVGSVRRIVADPVRADARQQTLVHFCHHKVGTVWFARVLRAVAQHYGLSFEHLEAAPPAPGTRIALQHHTRVDLASFGSFVGSHIVRDPRDVVVSGYHYHLWTNERAIVAPDPALGGASYQEHLRGLDRKAGLLAEIRRASSRAIREMAEWDYDDPRFLELRYEDALADDHATFTELFRHYGFSDRAVERSAEIARAFGFRQMAGRPLGEVQEDAHLRSGLPGQWRDEFNENHVALFKELAGDALVTLGYEADDRW